ncbi:hypothetical protein D9M68_862270 [compost metagenome]
MRVRLVGCVDGGAPARYARLPLAHAPGEGGVCHGLRIGVGQAASQVEASHENIFPDIGQLDAGGAHLVDVLHARDRGARDELVVERIARGLVEQGGARQPVAQILLGRKFAGP